MLAYAKMSKITRYTDPTSREVNARDFLHGDRIVFMSEETLEDPRFAFDYPRHIELDR